MLDVVRQALKLANLNVDVGEIALDDDLFNLGLTSFGCVEIMLRIEERLDIEFPDDMMRLTMFDSIASIIRGIDAARAEGAMLKS